MDAICGAAHNFLNLNSPPECCYGDLNPLTHLKNRLSGIKNAVYEGFVCAIDCAEKWLDALSNLAEFTTKFFQSHALLGEDSVYQLLPVRIGVRVLETSAAACWDHSGQLV